MPGREGEGGGARSHRRLIANFGEKGAADLLARNPSLMAYARPGFATTLKALRDALGVWQPGDFPIFPFSTPQNLRGSSGDAIASMCFQGPFHGHVRTNDALNIIVVATVDSPTLLTNFHFLCSSCNLLLRNAISKSRLEMELNIKVFLRSERFF